MSKDTGGPAFPLVAETHEHVLSIGVTLRDYFAGQTLIGIFSNTHMLAAFEKGQKSPQRIANACYEMADAMLAERAQAMSTQGYDPSTGYMDFSLALREMKKGKKARRAGWPDGEWIRFGEKSFFQQDGEECLLRHSAIVATDWEEVL